MPSLALTRNGDLNIQSNTIGFVDGADAVTQHLRAKFMTFLEEYFYNTEIGLPYYQEILVKGQSLPVVSNIFKNYIFDTPGVLELLAFDMSYAGATRKLTITFQVLSDDGLIDFNEEIEV